MSRFESNGFNVAIRRISATISEMTIPARDLRNDVSAVLRRVEAGERLTVTISGRPVAELSPLGRRPRTMPSGILVAAIHQASADPELTQELAEALPDTTDDIL